MDISIIIVSWNAKAHLLHCLNSIVKNIENITYEIIVVDNGSTDGTIESVKENYPSVHLVLNERNLGFARANNIGITRSSGKYLLLVNSDIEILDSCINKIHSFVEAHKNIGMLGPKILNKDMSLQLSCRRIPTLWNLFCVSIFLNKIFPDSPLFPDLFMRKTDFTKIRSVGILSGCFWCLSREAVDDVGLLDDRFFIYAEDMDWSKRFHDSKWEVIFYPEANAIHFGGASSSNAPLRFYIEMQIANRQYWKKHHGNISTFFFILININHHIIRLIIDSIMAIFCMFRETVYNYKIKRHFSAILWNLGLYDNSKDKG